MAKSTKHFMSPNKIVGLGVGVLILGSLFVISSSFFKDVSTSSQTGVFYHSSDSQNLEQQVEIDEVRNAIHRCARYLTKKVQPDGKFEYRIHMDPAISLSKKYNILRHSGTIYAMVMYYQRHPDDKVRAAIEQTGRYLRDGAINPLSGKGNMLAVWSQPKVNHSGRPLQAKLGGTGLGLVALLSIEQISPGFTRLLDLQALGRFIVYMQKPDGSFYSKYVPSRGGRLDKWRSLYYPGEAALGLLMLYEKDRSHVWLKSASKALEYLARSRANQTNIPADHWALLATAKILALDNGKNKLPVSRQLLIKHAIQICETMLDQQIVNPNKPKYYGGFSNFGKTTPSATRLEGLLATLTFIPSDHKIRKRIESSVTRGISFLLRAQVTNGKFAGAIPRAVAKLERKTSYTKQFNRRAAEVRIDYLQHAMSAMMQYLDFVK